MPAARADEVTLEKLASTISDRFREHGRRLISVEQTLLTYTQQQATISEQLSGISGKVVESCEQLKALNGTVREHEVKLALVDQLINSHVKPAVQDLTAQVTAVKNDVQGIRLQISKSAALGSVLGGGGLVALIEFVKWLASVV